MLDPSPRTGDFGGVAPDEEESVGTLISRLVAEGRSLAQAELTLVKAKAGERVGAYRSAAIFFGAAGVLALAALIALLVGLELTLAPLVGPGGATAIVVLVTLAIAAVLALIGKRSLAPRS